MVLLLSALLAAAPAVSDKPPADLPACPSGSETPDVAALMKRTETVLEGRSMVAVMTMGIKTPSYERSVKMKLWTKGRDFALVKVLEGGPRETGMMTLKREKQLWNYLPQAGRVMKLPSGMMGDSWMGSDFTNDDLVHGSSISNDFTSSVDKTVEHEGRKAWFVTLKPRPEAKTVWGRVEMLLDRQSCIPLEERFYDEDGALARRMAFSDLQKVGWRTFPMKMTVTPAEAGRQTTISYAQLELDGEVPDDTFSLRRLQQGKE
ncbi:MAG: outer membrane lipoprotein-sorting protein [Archangiaceae bacterium]|nr:outer membrane lipoprotein-sorting protein [Archangiaceae bacterium]